METLVERRYSCHPLTFEMDVYIYIHNYMHIALIKHLSILHVALQHKENLQSRTSTIYGP